LQDLVLTSRHGLITSAALPTLPDSKEWAGALRELCDLLEGERYETVQGLVKELAGRSGRNGERLRVLVEWVKGEMR
jgi:hypothetical protein